MYCNRYRYWILAKVKMVNRKIWRPPGRFFISAIFKLMHYHKAGVPLTGPEKKDIYKNYAGHRADAFSRYRLRSTTTEIIYGQGYY